MELFHQRWEFCWERFGLVNSRDVKDMVGHVHQDDSFSRGMLVADSAVATFSNEYLEKMWDNEYASYFEMKGCNFLGHTWMHLSNHRFPEQCSTPKPWMD